MAKRIPIPTLIEMEMILGYKVSLSPPLITDWFYSNLGPVYHDIYKRTEREFEEHEKQRHQNIIPEGDIVNRPLCYLFQANTVIDNYTWPKYNNSQA
jgi:hypothetical protein